MKPDSMTKQEYSVNRRVGTFSVLAYASLKSTWTKKHADPTSKLQTKLDEYFKELSYGA
jgi:hypothetical protein